MYDVLNEPLQNAVLVSGPGEDAVVGVPMQIRGGVLVEAGTEATPRTPETVVTTSTAVFVDHALRESDTLQMVSLKYNVSEGSILRANMLLTNDSFEFLSTGTVIKVPVVPGISVPAALDPKTESIISLCARYKRTTGQDLSRDTAAEYLEENSWDEEAAYTERLEKQEVIRRCMQVYEEAHGERINRAEAEFYLLDNDWNVDTACAARVEDIAWEKEHPFPGPSPSAVQTKTKKTCRKKFRLLSCFSNLCK